MPCTAAQLRKFVEGPGHTPELGGCLRAARCCRYRAYQARHRNAAPDAEARRVALGAPWRRPEAAPIAALALLRLALGPVLAGVLS